jgi:hypothetical protein
MYRKLLFRKVVVAILGLLIAPLASADDLVTYTLNDAAAEAPAAAPADPPPLPFHTIEGVGGGAITPMAYLVNPGGENDVFGKPAVALTYVNLGLKNLSAITVTETVCQRIELGYAADRLGLGTLPGAIHEFTQGAANNYESDIWMHNFNARALLVKENTDLGGIAMPAITAGVQFKVNGNIQDIDNEVGGAITGIGYRRNSGQDFTLTATKMIPPDVLGRPVIVTLGGRVSESASLGFLGFGDEYRATVEGSVAFLPFDKLLLAYEFRGKTDPYNQLPGLIDGEDNWHAFDAALILNSHSTLVAGYGIFGTLANSNADGAWWLQLKYEF